MGESGLLGALFWCEITLKQLNAAGIEIVDRLERPDLVVRLPVPIRGTAPIPVLPVLDIALEARFRAGQPHTDAQPSHNPTPAGAPMRPSSLSGCEYKDGLNAHLVRTGQILICSRKQALQQKTPHGGRVFHDYMAALSTTSGHRLHHHRGFPAAAHCACPSASARAPRSSARCTGPPASRGTSAPGRVRDREVRLHTSVHQSCAAPGSLTHRHSARKRRL